MQARFQVLPSMNAQTGNKKRRRANQLLKYIKGYIFVEVDC